MTFNPDYVPSGLNNRLNEYYKKINHVKISRVASSRSEFFGYGGPDYGTHTDLILDDGSKSTYTGAVSFNPNPGDNRLAAFLVYVCGDGVNTTEPSSFSIGGNILPNTPMSVSFDNDIGCFLFTALDAGMPTGIAEAIFATAQRACFAFSVELANVDQNSPVRATSSLITASALTQIVNVSVTGGNIGLLTTAGWLGSGSSAIPYAISGENLIEAQSNETGFVTLDDISAGVAGEHIPSATVKQHSYTKQGGTPSKCVKSAIEFHGYLQIPAVFTLDEPVIDGFVYGLNSTRTSAPVPVSGTYTGNPTRINARVVTDTGTQVVGWTTIDASPSGGVYSGTISVPPQGLTQLRVEVRDSSIASTAVAQTGLWLVGIVIASYGQSNSISWSTHGVAGGNGAISPSLQYNAVAAAFGYQDKGVIAFCDRFSTLTGLPILAISGGKNSVDIDNLMAGTDPMNEMLAGITAHANGTVHALLWNQGEGDSLDSKDPNVYPAKLNTLRDTLATATGQTGSDIPIVISPLMTTGRDDGFQSDASWTDFKDMQRAMPTNPAVPNVHIAGSVDDMIRLDVYHSYDGSYAFRGDREAAALATILGMASVDPMFVISEVEATNATTTTLTVQHGEGTDFTFVALNHEVGTEVPVAGDGTMYNVEVASDDWTTPITATGVRTNATTITLTHADPGPGERLVRYMYGRPLGDEAGIAVDNSAYAFPLFWEKSITIPDIIAPTLVSSVPSNGATGVSGSSTIVLTFSEPVFAGTGTFILRNVTQDVTEETFTPSTGLGNAGGTVGIADDVVTLTPGADMTTGETYSVQWTENAVKDAVGHPLAANNSDATLSFDVLAATANLFTRDPNLQDPSAWNLIAGVSVSGGKMIYSGTQAVFGVSPSLVPFDDIVVGQTYDVWCSIDTVTTSGKFVFRTMAYDAGDSFLANVTNFRDALDLVIGEPHIYRSRFTAAAGQVKFGFSSYAADGSPALTIDEFGLKEVAPGDTNVFYYDPNFENPALWNLPVGAVLANSQLTYQVDAWGSCNYKLAAFEIAANTAYRFIIEVSEYTSGADWTFTAVTDAGDAVASTLTTTGTGTFTADFTSPAGATNMTFRFYSSTASDLVFSSIRIEPVV